MNEMRPDNNTGSSVPYSLRIVCGFFHIPLGCKHSRVVRRGLRFIVLIREEHHLSGVRVRKEPESLHDILLPSPLVEGKQALCTSNSAQIKDSHQIWDSLRKLQVRHIYYYGVLVYCNKKQ